MNLVDQVKAAGVVGAGGAGFPTHVKLGASAEWFIVNAAECEPLIETDKYLCRTFPEEIVSTAERIGRTLGAKHVVVGLKAEYEEEAAALQAAIDRLKADVRLHTTRAFFPVGDEFVLVEEVTGRVIPEGGLPLQVGAVVDNVGTVLSVCRALRDEPVTEKYLSVVGEVRRPLMLKAPVGTAILDCIQAAEPLCGEYGVIIGGPMMGKALTDPEGIRRQVVTKTTGNLLVLPLEHELFRKAELPMDRIRARAKSACLQCQACSDLCPRHALGHRIRPHLMMRGIVREELITTDEDYAKVFGEAVNCSACGACELFSCPMGLSPRQVNQYLKGQLRARGLSIERRKDPVAMPWKEMRRIPTKRLVARLGLSKYERRREALECIPLAPQSVYIPFSQHIGRPAQPVRACGERVKKGELLAAAVEGALSANIHCSICGTIRSIDDAGAYVEAGKE